MTTQTADNTRKKDARLLYIMKFASSRFAALIKVCSFIASKWDDFFPPYVIYSAEHFLKLLSHSEEYYL